MCIVKDPEERDNPFADPDVRRKFRSRVFMVLAAQLAFTLPMMFIALYVDDVGDYLADHAWWFFIGMAFVMVSNICLIYCGFFLRDCPYIGIIGGLMTIGFTIMVMVAVSTTYEGYVYQALGSTFGIFVLCAAISLVAPCDFSVLWFIPLVISLIILISTLVFIFLPTKVLYIVIMSLVLTVCIISMLISLQQILAGHHVRFYYEPEDYAIAAIFLYADLITMLLVLMGLFSVADS